jgi:hypothetical protein
MCKMRSETIERLMKYQKYRVKNYKFIRFDYELKKNNEVVQKPKNTIKISWIDYSNAEGPTIRSRITTYEEIRDRAGRTAGGRKTSRNGGSQTTPYIR